MPLWLDRLFLNTVDALFALHPAARPGPESLHACRIVSHRGERDGRRILENTVAAFEPLRGSGVFGIEFDVRWTRDRMPVVFHDADLFRLFGDRTRLADLDRTELQRLRPEIPDLHAFVRRYVDEFHLMVELKYEPYPEPDLQNRRLIEALAPALERRRCHVLCLVPRLLDLLPGLPAERTMGIARLNTGDISAEALASGRAGIAGHYLALRERQITRHHAAGQSVGCGFPRTRTVLCREIGRGVDFVFTDHALRMERWRREALQAWRNSSTARL